MRALAGVFVLALPCLFVVALIDPRPDDLIVAGTVLLVATVAHVYLHELGHLVGALVLRLRVQEVSVFAGRRREGMRVGGARVRLGLFGQVNRVVACARPGQRLVPARLVLFALSGPAANLAGAGVTYAMLRHPPAGTTLLGTVGLFVALLVGVLLGLSDLVPVRIGEMTSDGALVLRLLFRRDGRRRDGRRRDERRRAAARRTDPGRTVAEAYARVLALLGDARRQGRAEIDPELLRPVADLAERAYATSPARPEATVVLALVRLFQHRPAEVRRLLVACADATPTQEHLRVAALAVRAIAEVELGDLAQARRLVDAGRRIQPNMPLLRLAVAALDAASEQAAPPDAATAQAAPPAQAARPEAPPEHAAAPGLVADG
jgi:hypothetical protein